MANFFEELDKSRPQTVATPPGVPRITVTPNDPPMNAAPKQAEQQPADVGQGTAALEGYLSGASGNFRDEVYGASEASGLPGWMGGFRAPVGAGRLIMDWLSENPGEATALYERAVTEKRNIQKQAQQQHPGTYMAGEIGGALALPTGRLGTAATLPGRMAQGAGIGAAYGAVSGAGAGENLGDRAVRAGTGAAIGGVVGGVAAPVIEGGVSLADLATRPIRRAIAGSFNPEAEAARRVATAQQRDAAADPQAASRLTPAQFGEAQQRGQPVTNADMGGDLTRRLTDSAAITSPEGGTAINRTLNDRFETQAPRLTTWLQQTFHYPNADAQRQAIDQTARSVNRPAYQRAFNEHDGPMWDEALSGLAQDPLMQSAIRRAGVAVRTERTIEGYRPMNNPFTFEENSGRLILRRDPNGRTIFPDLQFWDLVKRELDKGGREGQNFARSLRDHLDELTRDASGRSSYQTARQGAAHFFGAENALEAGENFVGAGVRYGLPEARRTLATMTEQQRQLFQDGYVSRLVEKINALPDRRNALNIIGRSPADREELYIALGRDRAHELETFLRVEGIMELPRQMVQGNSWTAKRLYDLGLAGGGGLTGYGALNQDPQQMTTGAILAALSSGGKYIDQRVAQRVAGMLMSSDPSRVQAGVRMIARRSEWLNSLRSFDRRVSAAIGEQAGGGP